MGGIQVNDGRSGVPRCTRAMTALHLTSSTCPLVHLSTRPLVHLSLKTQSIFSVI
jgi:hypothetical protein